MKNIPVIFLLPIVFACGVMDPQEVTVYTHRHYDTDQQLFDSFTQKTGIAVNVVSAKADELIQRLQSEGELTSADILITADAGRLVFADELGLLQSLSSEVLEANVPASYREPSGKWFGLTLRGRVIVYDKTRNDASQLTSYEDLSGPEFQNTLLVRSSSNIYNQSLMASLIHHHGEEEAIQWARGILQNMARDPAGNDRDQMKALIAGEGEYAIVNTYYVGKLLASEDPQEIAVGEKIGVFFPNQEGRGTHMNISGAGVTTHAPNAENAQKLLEFLVSEEAQSSFAQANYEYPVLEGIPNHPVVESWGKFKADDINLKYLGEYNKNAVKVFDAVGWK
jgi:iron(III) transport system substrate-binding protein